MDYATIEEIITAASERMAAHVIDDRIELQAKLDDANARLAAYLELYRQAELRITALKARDIPLTLAEDAAIEEPPEPQEWLTQRDREEQERRWEANLP